MHLISIKNAKLHTKRNVVVWRAAVGRRRRDLTVTAGRTGALIADNPERKPQEYACDEYKEH